MSPQQKSYKKALDEYNRLISEAERQIMALPNVGNDCDDECLDALLAGHERIYGDLGYFAARNALKISELELVEWATDLVSLKSVGSDYWYKISVILNEAIRRYDAYTPFMSELASICMKIRD